MPECVATRAILQRLMNTVQLGHDPLQLRQSRQAVRCPAAGVLVSQRINCKAMQKDEGALSCIHATSPNR